jgi:hypothetical protein
MASKRTCIKVASLRKEYNDKEINLKKWLEDPNNVYVGRRGRIFINKEIYNYSDSKWRNIFKCTKHKEIDTIEKCLELYENYIKELIKKDAKEYNLDELKGKNLGCWCDYGDKCHVDVLLKVIKHV